MPAKNKQSTKKQELSSNDSEVLVRVNGVSKKFCRDLKKSLWYGMKDVASELLPIKSSKLKIKNSDDALRPGELWANKDISFELRRGECIGLIGRNGAGKTTLLKMLNGLIKPDEGSIEMRGRVGALIALGAGFNPILTGRENIYVNGSILGLSKEEISDKIEDIIDFAEIRDFIDSPVQSYSSGMQVRLGFAVATALDPDVLILDEVLAVGDLAFRTKCYNRIFELCKDASVIFVSHTMSHISRMCTQTILLKNGQLEYYGDTTHAIDEYNKMGDQGSSDQTISEGVEIEPIEINGSHQKSLSIEGNDGLNIKFKASFPSSVNSLQLNISFLDNTMSMVSWLNNTTQKQRIVVRHGFSSYEINIPNLNFGSGTKILSLAIRDEETNAILYWNQDIAHISVRNHPFIPVNITHYAEFRSY